jgi:septal ring factor EnvC (AmiA/AmiB activator)
MKEVQKELAELSEQIEESKTKLSKLEGQRIELLKNVKEILGVKTIEEAEKELKKLIAQQNEIEKEIKTGLDKLKTVYGWN